MVADGPYLFVVEASGWTTEGIYVSTCGWYLFFIPCCVVRRLIHCSTSKFLVQLHIKYMAKQRHINYMTFNYLVWGQPEASVLFGEILWARGTTGPSYRQWARLSYTLDIYTLLAALPHRNNMKVRNSVLPFLFSKRLTHISASAA